MYAADAAGNSATLPAKDVADTVLKTLHDTTLAVVEEHRGFGIDATPDRLCAVLAAATARVATRVTGDQHRVQSGRWARFMGLAGNTIDFLARSGKGQDFHAWVVAAHPGRRLSVVDVQGMFWEAGTPYLIWNWDHELFRRGIAWQAQTATTNRVIAVAEAHTPIVDAIYAGAMEVLVDKGLVSLATAV